MLDLPKRPYQRLCPPYWNNPTDKAFCKHLRTGNWKDHSKSRTFERVIARRLDVPHEWVLATNSCTTALGVAFTFLEKHFPIKDGMPVCRVCPLTYPATYCWAINFGWDIEWVDCDENGWPLRTVDVGVDLWGRALRQPALILDAAHRVFDPDHAVRLRDGTSRAVCYSFGPTKEVPCLEGGALIAPFLADCRPQAEALIQSGQGNPRGGGWKGYLSAPSAAALSKQVGNYVSMRERRQNVLREYQDWFGDALLTKPGEASGHLAVVRLPTPGHVLAAKNRMRKLGIEHSLHFPIPEAIATCPRAKDLVASLVSLPCNVEMRRHDVLLVARAVLTAV